MVRQVIPEVNWLNDACASEVLELEKQLLDINKLIMERKNKVDRNAAPAGEHGRSIRHDKFQYELQLLELEQQSIGHRLLHSYATPSIHYFSRYDHILVVLPSNYSSTLNF